jgi:hypothetical protein
VFCRTITLYLLYCVTENYSGDRGPQILSLKAAWWPNPVYIMSVFRHVSDLKWPFSRSQKQLYRERHVRKCVKLLDTKIKRGTRWRSWLRHCATSCSDFFCIDNAHKCARYQYKKSLLLARHVFRNNSCVLGQ